MVELEREREEREVEAELASSAAISANVTYPFPLPAGTVLSRAGNGESRVGGEDAELIFRAAVMVRARLSASRA